MAVPEKDYKKTFEHISAAVLLIATDAPAYTILDVNEAYLTATNSTRGQLVGKSVFGAFPANPTDEESKNIERTIFSFEEAIRTQQPHTMSNYRYDIPMRGTDEFEERYWTTTNSPVLDEQGRVSYLIHSPANVTELNKLRQREIISMAALKTQREQLYAIFMQAPVGIAIFRGPEFIVDLINPPLCEIYGKTVEEMMGRPVFDVLLHIRDLGFDELLDQVRLTGVPFKGQAYLAPLFRNGQLQNVYFDFVYEPFREIDGTISGVIAVATEVTDQVTARQRIEEAEERTRLAVDAVGLGTYDLNLETGEMITTPQFARIFGFDRPVSRNEYIGVFHPDDLASRLQAHADAVTSGKLFYESRVCWPDGSLRWVRVDGKVYYDKAGAAVRILGTLLDITEQKELQRQKDDFIGIASHELKTPVTSIKAYTQVLGKMLAQKGEAREADMIRRVDGQLNRLTSLIGDLLDVTKINAGKLRFNDREFDFDAQVVELVEDLRHTTDKHTLVLQAGAQCLVYGDQERIDQVITNLISNAIKYSPLAGEIIIATRREGNEVILSVQDFGIGIDGADLDRVFEQFYRVSGEMQHTFAGLGLGLYISAEIIRREGGRIWVDSQKGKGATFCFALPIKK